MSTMILRFDPPDGVDRVPNSWNWGVMAFSAAFAAFGCYSSMAIVERIARFRLDGIASLKSDDRGRGPMVQPHGRSRAAGGWGRSSPVPPPYHAHGLVSAAFCASINLVWLMHFIAIVAVTHDGRKTRYEATTTALSMLFIFVATLVGTLLMAAVDPLARGDAESFSLLPPSVLTEPVPGGAPLADVYLAAPNAHEVIAKLRSWRYMSRVAIAGVSVGIGVILMHFTGMAAMRVEDAIMTLNPTLVILTCVYAAVGGMIFMFALFTLRGPAWRLLVSAVIGVAFLGAHSLGYVAVEIYDAPPGEDAMDINQAGLFSAEAVVVAGVIFASLVRTFLIVLAMES
mmetsp:Transcript_28394/g.91990  ORF Transcript_28394/g.91990 Transcript_28394/m.91990 type:complete len:342 (+) Transcript_28394:49-1074(+)